jgi:hypothetical protein
MLPETLEENCSDYGLQELRAFFMLKNEKSELVENLKNERARLIAEQRKDDPDWNGPES